MFRDEEQRHAVCQTLCSLVDRPELWTDTGPSPRMVTLLTEESEPKDVGVILNVVWMLWTSRTTSSVEPALARSVTELTGAYLSSAFGLIIALIRGYDEVDQWVAHEMRAILHRGKTP
jgi:hypothetical protein